MNFTETQLKKIGTVAWVSTAQFFIVQIFVALAWKSPFSIKRNAISDLGNTLCQIYDKRYVCSPLHNYMNASFVLLGLAMIIGSYIYFKYYSTSATQKLAFTLIGIGGFGSMIVGVAPENLLPIAHAVGAALPFGVGNVGILLAGIFWVKPKLLRYFTITLGSVAIMALPLFLAKTYVGIGLGGMERIVAYPQTIWFITIGCYYVRKKD